MRAEEFIKENETIMEVPLPSDWDIPQSSYKKRIEYAVARAQKLAAGSSRVAFTIDYDGRPTVLKIAKNKKGMGQNEAEARLLNDYTLQHLGIAIPIIDYDQEHRHPVWIQTEKANKATEKQLCAIMKCPSLDILIEHASYIANGINASKLQNWLKERLSEDDMETFFEYSDKLTDLSVSYKLNIHDFKRAKNWGILPDGSPVIIDLGYTEDVQKNYYY